MLSAVVDSVLKVLSDVGDSGKKFSAMSSAVADSGLKFEQLVEI
jgi:hypothetical protein